MVCEEYGFDFLLLKVIKSNKMLNKNEPGHYVPDSFAKLTLRL
jgi:hypothetical protein